MSSYEIKLKNDTQNFLQTNENPKNFSNCKQLDSESLAVSRTQEIPSKNQKTSFGSQFPMIANTGKSKEPEEKLFPKITEWRRAVMEDKYAIRQLKTLTGDVTNSLFRRQNIDELIETSYFPIVQIDSMGNLISFTAYDSYPDLEPMPLSWKDWLTVNYGIKGVTSGNVLFIHHMVWHPKYEGKFLLLLLETLFTEFMHLSQIIVIKPPKENFPDFYSKYFIPVLPFGLENFEVNSVQLLLVCLRSSVIHPLYIRTAFEQEFDVIMSVLKNNLKKTNTESTSSVWDFFDLFSQKNKKTLICEFEGQVAGIMILNLKINLDVLNEWFELAPFNGLKKRDFEDKYVDYESVSVPETSSSKVQKDANLLISSEFLFTQMNWEMMLSELKPNDSLLSEPNSSSSLSDSQFSQFSIFRMSSLIDLDETNISPSPSHGKSDTLFKMGGINLVIRTSESAMTHFFPPKYHGDSNAFIIDFFAIDCNKVDEKLSSYDFLKAAFNIVPDREYCVLLIPTDLLPFPLLDSFVRVTPRPASCFKQELYLCHKNSLSVMSMSVRSTVKNDLTSIKHFLKNVDEGDTVYQDILNNSFGENNSFKSFVLTFEEAIIGVSLLNSQHNSENFHMYFEVADFSSAAIYETEKFSVIKHLVISPMYQNHARFFVRDIMRLEAVSCLYYAYNKPCKNRPSLLTVLGEFAPIKPKKKVGFIDPFHQVTLPFPEKTVQENCFSLYFLNPRLCGFHKIHMNIVIVVVGASRTALSFLENLIFGPESWLFNYNNIICVTTNGLETENVDTDFKNLMFPNNDNFSKKYITMLSLETYVNFIYGIMTKINRSEKYIVVNNKAVIKYDYLILTCGLQYSTPIPEARKIFLKNPCQNNFTSSLARFLPRFSEKRKLYIPKHLNNMFIINTSSDAQNALRILQFLMQKIQKSGDKKIIVYGHDLQVFLTIHTLLKLGIPGEFIVFVEPFPSDTTTVTLFNDYSIDQAVLESVRELKVNYYTNYFLYDWSLSSEDYITAIKFHSSRKQIVIPCLAFFPFLEKLVSDVNFNACSNAGLVYDGRLVINHNFRTNDKHIYAAGPFTKYARRYFASEHSHQYYNSREVGQKLAEIIKELITPVKEKRAQEEEEYDLVPQLKAPVVLHCQLPGDFNLFTLRKPGKEIDLETAYNFFNYGEVLTTGDCRMKTGFGYFRLHLNPQGFVESITCYTKDKIDYANLYALYGLHERILNNLLLRFDLAMIPDLFEYFRQPWAMALFHEDFQRLRDCNSKTFLKKMYQNKSFCDKVVEELKAENWHSLPNSTKEDLEIKYLNSKMAEDVKNNLMQFLEHYRKDLPVYATFDAMKYLFKERSRP